MRSKTLSMVVLAIAVFAAPAFSASPNIGIASAVDTFSLDNSPVNGSTGVFDGAELRTTVAPSDVHLKNGVDVRLATRSSGTIYGDRLILERGALRARNFDRYTIDARRLRIEAENPAAEALVRLKGDMVEVASIGGAVKVYEGSALLAHIASGTKMSFQQTGASPEHNGNASGQTGANPGVQPVTTGAAKPPRRDKKAILWTIAITGVAAAVVGTVAGVQGKNPF